MNNLFEERADEQKACQNKQEQNDEFELSEEELQQGFALLKKVVMADTWIKRVLWFLLVPVVYILVGLTYGILPTKIVLFCSLGIYVVAAPVLLVLAKTKDRADKGFKEWMKDEETEEKQDQEKDVFDV